MDDVIELCRQALGIGVEARELALGQIVLRGVVVFIVGVALVRLGPRRFLGRHAAFDALLGFILGSVLSRAINGEAAFFEALVVSAVLITLHWLVAWLAFESSAFGYLVKGEKIPLVSGGRLQQRNMRATAVTERDLRATLRSRGEPDNLDRIEDAYVERDGEISTVMKAKAPRVLEVSVAEGVQTVRIIVE